MLTKKILSFLSTQSMVSASDEELHDIRPYQTGDNRRSINRKKTAKYDQIMTNIYEPDIHVHGILVKVISSNRSKGHVNSMYQQVQELIDNIAKSIKHDQMSNIKTIEIDSAPKRQLYSANKAVIISDFFWDKAEMHDLIQACIKGDARGIVLPLLTPFGPYTHPLLYLYPEYFWKLA